MKEAEVQREFEKWAGGFVGVFPLGKDRYGDYQSVLTGNVWIGWRKAFETGERKERERCAKVAEDHSIDGWDVGDEIAEVIRGGESTT